MAELAIIKYTPPSRRRILPEKYDGKVVYTVVAGCEILGLSRSLAYAAAKDSYASDRQNSR